MGEMQKKVFQIGIWEVVKKQVRENEYQRELDHLRTVCL